MKSEDIIKLYKEEKNDLSAIRIFIALNVLIFLFQSIQAQTYVNGFCRQENVSSSAGFQKIFTFDINQDSLKDVVIYKPGERNYIVHRAITANKFTESSDKTFDYRIDDLNSYSTQNNEIVFASRDSKTIGIASISYFGLMNIVFKQDISSFPNRIYTADMNNDGNKKIIAAGNSCAGIHIVNPKNKVKPNLVLFPEKAFESLAIFDFNYDFYNDLVAIDFLDNQLVFINNYSNDYFLIERVIPFRNKISDLTLTKFNNDSFYDLAFVTDNSIEILLGDSVYSFYNKISIPTESRISSFAIGDFNDDGFNDIAYYIKSEKAIKILFSNGSYGALSPFDLKNDICITEIASTSDEKTKLLAYCSDGNFLSFSRVNFNEKEYSISSSGKVGTSGSFATENFSYFYYLDEDFQSLKIYQHNGNQAFKFFYSVPVSKNFENIFTEVINKDFVRFFCYSNNLSLLEIIDYDFKANKTNKNRLIAEGPLNDFLFERRKKNLIKLLATDRNDLISSVYESTSGKTKFLYEDTVYNSIGGIYSKVDTRKVFDWRLNNSKISFELSGLSDGSKTVLKILDLKDFNFDVTKLKMSRILDNYNEIVLSYFAGGNFGKLFYYSANELKEAKIKNVLQFSLFKNLNHINLVSKLILNKEKYFIYDQAFDLEVLSNLINTRKIDNYNMISISKRKYFMYSSVNDSKITFIGVK